MQIFEPFFTTHEFGTGLGLYLARQMCEANQASLEYVAGRGRWQLLSHHVAGFGEPGDGGAHGGHGRGAHMKFLA